MQQATKAQNAVSRHYNICSVIYKPDLCKHCCQIEPRPPDPSRPTEISL